MSRPCRLSQGNWVRLTDSLKKAPLTGLEIPFPTSDGESKGQGVRVMPMPDIDPHSHQSA